MTLSSISKFLDALFWWTGMLSWLCMLGLGVFAVVARKREKESVNE